MGGLRVCKESANRKAKVTMVQGETVVLTTDKAFDGASDEKTLYIGYELLSKKLSPGIKVLLDDGLISLEVHEVRSDGTVACVVLNGAEIGERKGVNLPGVVTELPALSEKDKADIRFGIANDIDCVAASFVRSAHAVEEIRDYIAECHAELCADATTTPPPLIISKIETTEALENLEEIVEASDGIMVARGDLGVEVPIEQVCTWQKTMVGMCNAEEPTADEGRGGRRDECRHRARRRRHALGRVGQRTLPGRERLHPGCYLCARGEMDVRS